MRDAVVNLARLLSKSRANTQFDVWGAFTRASSTGVTQASRRPHAGFTLTPHKFHRGSTQASVLDRRPYQMELEKRFHMHISTRASHPKDLQSDPPLARQWPPIQFPKLVYPGKISYLVYIQTCQVDLNRLHSEEGSVIIDIG